MEVIESSSNLAEKVEAGHLLDQGWFFGNLLNTPTRTTTTTTKIMSRCHSDLRPPPTPTYTAQDMFVTIKSSVNGSSSSSSSSSRRKAQEMSHNLMRTPSLPASLMTTDEYLRLDREDQGYYSFPNMSNARHHLVTTVSDEEVDEDDQDSEFTMGRLIRQASLNSSQLLNPPHSAKVMRQRAPSIPRDCLRKDPELMERFKERRSGSAGNEVKIGKNQNGVEIEGIDEGFKSMGLKCEKEKSRGGLENLKVRRKPYFPQGSSAGTIPATAGWVEKSSTENMKAQIKFWARAVASNVRQEC